MKPTDVIDPSWEPLKPLLNEPKLVTLRTEIIPNIISYPESQSIFRVFKTPVNKIKIVILGQDPYHGMKQANGLAFAVQPHISIPPSLRIIHSEIKRSAEGTEWEKAFREGENNLAVWRTLHHWENQGVFLLNTALTVESGKPGSHLEYWKRFTEKVISFIGYNNPCIWFLWGAKAQAFRPFIGASFDVKGYDDETIEAIPMYKDMNYIFSSPHPASELYNTGKTGFVGNNHFKYGNTVLKRKNNSIIYW